MPNPKPFFLISTFSLLLLTAIAKPSCSSSLSLSCPPFNSSLPYPFSTIQGCGHPSFHIKCATPHSFLTINNFSFPLLDLNPNSSSLFLSPPLPNCSSPHFHPIELSNTPFRVTDASCSRLAVLRSCSPPNLPNCSRCPSDCKLVKSHGQILRGCGATRSPSSEQGCQADVLGFLVDLFTSFGVEIAWDESRDPYFVSCRRCVADNGVCGFNSSDSSKHFVCFRSKSSVSPSWIASGKNLINRTMILSLIISMMCLLFAISGVIAIFRSRRRLKSATGEEDPTTLFLHRHRSANLLPPVFTFDELESSTNKFDTKRNIGDGGFGSVYLGQLYDGRIVAVKYLHKHHRHLVAAKSFCNEILILSSIDHPNLVRLHGYCSDPRGLLLVYDYIPNGTLADHLHGRKSLYRKISLTWQTRLDIASQIASAMHYLHFSVVPPIVHRDMTSSNIFVEQDMKIKVGDFGLSRLLSETTSSSTSSSGFVWTGPQGTPGYLDPDYHKSFRLTEKSDVYSFGVILLELLTGLKAVDQSREKREMTLVDLVVSKIQMGLLHQVVDTVLAADPDAMDGGVGAVAELAFRCVAADKDDRPDAKEVLEELKRVKERVRVE